MAQIKNPLLCPGLNWINSFSPEIQALIASSIFISSLLSIFFIFKVVADFFRRVASSFRNCFGSRGGRNDPPNRNVGIKPPVVGERSDAGENQINLTVTDVDEGRTFVPEIPTPRKNKWNEV